MWEFCPGHRLQNNWGFVAQHRMIGEDILGRPLVQSRDARIAEVVHHRDECRTNNSPDNLEVMTKRDHRLHHARKRAESQRSRLTETMARSALEGRSLRDAARLLKVDTQTLRNRFPELVRPRQRKSPVVVADPASVELIRPYAADPKWGLKETAKVTRISAMSILRICEIHGLHWVRKSKAGEIHRTYRRKSSPTA